MTMSFEKVRKSKLIRVISLGCKGRNQASDKLKPLWAASQTAGVLHSHTRAPRELRTKKAGWLRPWIQAPVSSWPVPVTGRGNRHPEMQCGQPFLRAGMRLAYSPALDSCWRREKLLRGPSGKNTGAGRSEGGTGHAAAATGKQTGVREGDDLEDSESVTEVQPQEAREAGTRLCP